MDLVARFPRGGAYCGVFNSSDIEGRCVGLI